MPARVIALHWLGSTHPAAATSRIRRARFALSIQSEYLDRLLFFSRQSLRNKIRKFLAH